MHSKYLIIIVSKNMKLVMQIRSIPKNCVLNTVN